MKIKSLAIIFLSLVLLIPSIALASSDSNSDLKVFVGGGLTVHEIDLKATKMGNGQVIPVSNFEIEPENVVQLNKDQNLVVTLSTNDVNRIDTVKVVDANNIPTDLVNQGNNVYPIQNLQVGTYLLNVIVDTENGQAGYETILVVLEPGGKAESPNTVINNVKQWVIVKVKNVFKFPPERPEEGQLPRCEDVNDVEPCIRIVQPIAGCIDEAMTKCYTNSYERQKLLEAEEKEKEKGRVPCTPDGPPCPPCPDGVEAGWCADEDERQDTDDPLPPPPEDEIEEEELESDEIEDEEGGGADKDEGSSGSGDGNGGDGNGGDGNGGDGNGGDGNGGDGDTPQFG